MMTNNYRRLHKIPMVHTKRYPHQSRFKKRYGFTFAEMMESIHRVIDGMVDAVCEMAKAITKWVRSVECQKLTS